MKHRNLITSMMIALPLMTAGCGHLDPEQLSAEIRKHLRPEWKVNCHYDTDKNIKAIGRNNVFIGVEFSEHIKSNKAAGETTASYQPVADGDLSGNLWYLTYHATSDTYSHKLDKADPRFAESCKSLSKEFHLAIVAALR